MSSIKLPIKLTDLYFILLFLICIVLLILLWKTQSNLDYLLDLYVTDCYIQPAQKTLVGVFNGTI